MSKIERIAVVLLVAQIAAPLLWSAGGPDSWYAKIRQAFVQTDPTLGDGARVARAAPDGEHAVLPGTSR